MPTTSPAQPVAHERSNHWQVIVVVGVIAAMHIWKLPGALESIRAELGMSLVAAGTLLGLVQVASMLLGLVVSLFAELIGLRRTLVIGLVLFVIGSAAGAASPNTSVLMVTRTFEGMGFLMSTVVAPALIRRNTRLREVNYALGWWGAFQGIAAFLAILVSTLLLTVVSWRVWWVAMTVATAAILPIVLARIPADPPAPESDSRRAAIRAVVVRIGHTLRTLAPWGIAVVFSCYTLQWGAVIGFLPTIFAENGVDALVAGAATAAVAGVNGLGNVLTGLWLQRGAPMRALVLAALTIMAVTSAALFAVNWSAVPGGLVWQVLVAALFSFGGAAIPSCLTRLAVDVAPARGSAASVLGLMLQIYNAANFVGPILLAAVAAAVGGWHFSWVVTVSASAVGLIVAMLLLRGRVMDVLRHR